MLKVDIKGNIIWFYGNAVGYVEGGRAVIDCSFRRDELENYLSNRNMQMEWRDGIYEKLIHSKPEDMKRNMNICKKVRVYQLRSEMDAMMKFIGLKERMMRGFGQPDISQYDLVYDGALGTDNLEEIWQRLNEEHPKGYQGYSLSMSDVVELYSNEENKFYYVDTFGFQEISFSESSQINTMQQTLQ